MDYFKSLLDLLKIERDEDRQLYQKLKQNSSVPQRRASGLTWYPIAIRDQGMCGTRPIEIKDGAWLGANAVVVSGVTVGRNAVIGANAVVTSDVPDYAVAVGIPARVLDRSCTVCRRDRAPRDRRTRSAAWTSSSRSRRALGPHEAVDRGSSSRTASPAATTTVRGRVR